MKFATVITLLFTTTANAQKANPNADLAETVLVAAQFTHADTVNALHNLFKSKRNTGRWLAGGSATILLVGGTEAALDNHGKSAYSPTSLWSMFLFGIISSPAWIPGSISLIRFNKKRELIETEQYERTHKLPYYLHRRLNGIVFNNKSSKRN